MHMRAEAKRQPRTPVDYTVLRIDVGSEPTNEMQATYSELTLEYENIDVHFWFTLEGT